MVDMKIQNYITQAYSSIRCKSKRRGDKYPYITKEQLKEWLYKNGLKDLWIKYLESGMDKNLKPSIDRIDDYKGYEFKNMQLITWRENHLKGVNGEKHNNNSKNQNLIKKCFIWNKDGTLKKECKNYKEAAEYLGCHLKSISRTITGKRKTLKKYILTGKELEIKTK